MDRRRPFGSFLLLPIDPPPPSLYPVDERHLANHPPWLGSDLPFDRLRPGDDGSYRHHRLPSSINHHHNANGIPRLAWRWRHPFGHLVYRIPNPPPIRTPFRSDSRHLSLSPTTFSSFGRYLASLRLLRQPHFSRLFGQTSVRSTPSSTPTTLLYSLDSHNSISPRPLVLWTLSPPPPAP